MKNANILLIIDLASMLPWSTVWNRYARRKVEKWLIKLAESTENTIDDQLVEFVLGQIDAGFKNSHFR